MRAAGDASFGIDTLLPGGYYLCAVVDLDADNVSDPAWLETLVDASARLTLGEGEKKRHDVRLARGG